MSRQLADLLVKDKIITAAQYQEAAEAAKAGKSYIRFLIERKHLAENKLLYFLCQKFGLPSINLAKFEVNPEVIQLIPGDLAKRVQALPIQASKGTLVVAMCDPTNMSGMEDLKFKAQMNVDVVLTTHSAFDTAMFKYYGGTAAVASAIESYKKQESGESKSAAALELVQVHEIDSGGADQDAPVISMVNGILSEGIRRKASDIHVEPYEKRFRVRMRLDGVLHEIMQIPIEMKRAVGARLKIMSRMDIGESRIPQDGRIKLKYGGADIDFRVNTMPTLFGEKVVLRMLSNTNLQLDLRKLGFEQAQLDIFRRGIYSPNGMVLVTGPTGSGKTTTLYSALSELNQVADNLSTAEDPVEYNLDGVNQVQINKDVGLSFASVLRSLLRQDPDIVLVGEIRDYETAEVAIQAALTGHLVLSTLHTNDAASTVTRLVNMGVEPFLVVAAVNTILAQRLLRVICTKCKMENPIPDEKLVELGFASGTKVYKGKGCPGCNGTGYKGRISVYEVLEMSPLMKEMVLRGETMLELKKVAVKEGMQTLRMSAYAKVTAGVTTLEEAVSLTMAT